MSSTSITPYLYFSGRCEEAMEFYRKALDAKIEMMMRFSESPTPLPPGTFRAGFENKVMHATICIGESRLMASDVFDDKSKFEGFRLTLTVATEVAAIKTFAALAEGGSVQMPLSQTFWSPCYGVVTDRFNIGWMVMVAGGESYKPQLP